MIWYTHKMHVAHLGSGSVGDRSGGSMGDISAHVTAEAFTGTEELLCTDRDMLSMAPGGTARAIASTRC